MRFAGDGHEIDYEAQGEGRCIVFLHGLTFDRALLRETLEPVFAERPGWRRVYLDLPGHGASEAAGAHPSADGLVATLTAFVSAVGGDAPLVVGHAYGAYLAQALVAAGPKLAGLFLICPIVEPDLGARTVPPQRHTVIDETLSFESDEERQLFDGEVALHERSVLERFRRLAAPAHTATDRTFLGGVRGRYVSTLPLRSAARAFDAPVAIVCGRDDPWAGFLDAAELAAAYPRSSLAVVPESGPLLPIEAPEKLRSELADWLVRVSRR